MGDREEATRRVPEELACFVDRELGPLPDEAECHYPVREGGNGSRCDAVELRRARKLIGLAAALKDDPYCAAILGASGVPGVQ